MNIDRNRASVVLPNAASVLSAGDILGVPGSFAVDI